MKGFGIAMAVILLIALIVFGWLWSSRAGLIERTQAINSQWGQVENQYQRRHDLVPNLVATVENYMSQQKQTLKEVIELRQRVINVKAAIDTLVPKADAALLQKNVPLLDSLSRQISNQFNSLINVVVERYPDIKGERLYSDLQSQLEGTENRIAQERRKYNLDVKTYNTYRQKKLGSIIVGAFLGYAYERDYFKAEEEAKKAPDVKKLFENK